MIILPGNTPLTSFYPYDIDQSLRFNDDDSAYLHKTPAGAGDRKTWTFSTWVKRASLGSDIAFLGTGDAPQQFYFRFNASDNLELSDQPIGGGASYTVKTSAVFRDTGQWYHVLCVYDTTEAAEADRIKFFVNNTQHTLTEVNDGFPAQNFEGMVNRAAQHSVGRDDINATQYFDGYLAEVHFIDGQALTPSSFGESQNGVWIPKAYSGEYGTNGFHLDFANSSDIGNDVSGNNNDFTPTNLASADVVADSPTNNFAVWNILLADADIQTYQEGNLKVIGGGDVCGVASTFGMSSGKWYAEFKYHATVGNYIRIGLSDGIYSPSGYKQNYSPVLELDLDGTTYDYNNSAAGPSAAGAINDNDIGMIAVDRDNGKVWFGVNGTWINSGDPAAGTNATFSPAELSTGTWYFSAGMFAIARSLSANFGQDSTNVSTGNADDNGYGDFEYAPPAGFLALCSANLSARSTFTAYGTCGGGDEDGEVTYTGNGNADGPFVYLGGAPNDICINGNHYDPNDITYNLATRANGIKVLSGTTENTSAVSYTLKYWLETEYANDFKYSNARGDD